MIKIRSTEALGHKTRIYDEDGNDITEMIPIRKCILNLEVGKINTATLEVFANDLTIEAEAIIKKIDYKEREVDREG